MGEAVERWRRLVDGRVAEMERMRAGLRGPNAEHSRIEAGEFWDRRARRFAKGPMATAEGDPMLARLRRAVGRRSTLLDVGSGPGRFSLAVAGRAEGVVAVDPSTRMLAILRRRARAAGITNVRTVVGSWPEVEVERADVVLCAHVLPLVADAAPFVRRLDAVARRRVLLYLGTFAADGVLDPFWRYFHDTPRQPGATYLDAIRLIEELGIRPQVEVVEVRSRSRYATMAEAVDNYRDALVLDKSREVDRELRRLLEPWLQRRDGALWPPFRSQPAAILSWSPSASTVGGNVIADAGRT